MVCRLVDELDMEWAGVVVATEQTRWDPQVGLEQQLTACWDLVHCRTAAAAELAAGHPPAGPVGLACPQHIVKALQAPMLLASAALVMFAVESEQLGLTCLLARQVRAR